MTAPSMNNFLMKPKCWKAFGNVLTAWVRAESDGVLSYPQISLMMVIRRVKTKLTPQAGGHCRLIFVAISASEKEICEPNPNVATVVKLESKKGNVLPSSWLSW